MADYDHKQLEAKWQAEWAKSDYARAVDLDKRKKTYLLVEFPYPSGDGLHVGHVRSYTAMDVLARHRRAQGENVLYPIGWDAFGLPTENYAIKTGIDPRIVTQKNSDTFRRQLQALGLSFDWSREINTSDPAYYKWTQWLFLQFWKQGLAYKAKIAINWCPKDKIGLANEEVVDGKCERCGTPVEQKEKAQWLLAITKYADRLVSDLDLVDYPAPVKTQQKNWIGRREGAKIKFDDLEVFTTRPETIFGATFIALPGQADKFTGLYVTNPATQEKIPVWEAEYVMEGVGTGAVMGVPAHDERDFAFATKHNLPIKTVVEPSLVQTGDSSAFRPGEPMQDSYGIIAIVKHWSEEKYLGLTWANAPDWGTLLTGGIDEGMTAEETVLKEIQEETGYKSAKIVKKIGVIHGKYYHVPKKLNRFGHAPTFAVQLENGERDEPSLEEKSKHKLEWLTAPELQKFLTPFSHQTAFNLYLKGVFSGTGLMTNSSEFDGLTTEEAAQKITAKFGQPAVTYKLRDWVFSRQRYWGEPIPLVFCEKCQWQAVPDADLPVTLPEVANYTPTETGESPLAKIESWIKTTCPKCGGPARRESDVMPNWAGSSWYYLAYVTQDSKTKDYNLTTKPLLDYWTPVDWYNGGMEHTTLHLLYSRFWHKFLYDQKLVPQPEPYAKRTSHGLILAGDGEKMSKSRGNVINPDEIVARFGADSLRLYEMFMGPFAQAISWSTDGLVGMRRFLERVWRLGEQNHFYRALSADGRPRRDSKIDLSRLINQTIKKVGEDIEAQKFNTAVSALMILTNELEKSAELSQADYETLLRLLAPFAPHITEELWSKLGHTSSIHTEAWPAPSADSGPASQIIAVQVNGVTRDQITLAPQASEEAAERAARASERVGKWLADKPLKKLVYRPGRVINFVV